MDEQEKKWTMIVERVAKIGLLVAVATLAWIYLTTRPEASTSPDPIAEPDQVSSVETAPVPASAVIASSPLAKEYGLHVLSVSLTNDATMVQVLYTVVAPEKTRLLSGTNATASLINQADGSQLSMVTRLPQGIAPQGARARTINRMMNQAGRFPPSERKLIAGGVYSLEIPNWGRVLHKGSKVALMVGSLRQDDLTVE